MLLSGIMLKMGLYSIRWQLPIAPLAAKYIFISLGIAGVIYGSILALRQKT
jgi:NADH-quinone oxidoreductase subunit M